MSTDGNLDWLGLINPGGPEGRGDSQLGPASKPPRRLHAHHPHPAPSALHSRRHHRSGDASRRTFSAGLALRHLSHSAALQSRRRNATAAAREGYFAAANPNEGVGVMDGPMATDGHVEAASAARTTTVPRQPNDWGEGGHAIVSSDAGGDFYFGAGFRESLSLAGDPFSGSGGRSSYDSVSSASSLGARMSSMASPSPPPSPNAMRVEQPMYLGPFGEGVRSQSAPTGETSQDHESPGCFGQHCPSPCDPPDLVGGAGSLAFGGGMEPVRPVPLDAGAPRRASCS